MDNYDSIQTLYRTEGFVVLRGVLDASEVDTLRSTVYGYFERQQKTGRISSTAFGGNQGGWYFGGAHEDSTLREAVAIIDGQPRLHAALSHILSATPTPLPAVPTSGSSHRSYRMLSRNEIYIDRSGTWHADTVIGVVKAYTPPSLRECVSQNPYGCFWDPLPGDGEVRSREYAVATVATYLEPHHNGSQALHVKPRTHQRGDVEKRGIQSGNKIIVKYPYTFTGRGKRAKDAADQQAIDGMVLHPRMGDIIVFDSRLVHRGQDERFANLDRRRVFKASDPHRGLLALTYGRNNGFSESHDRAFAMRNELIRNRSLCGGQWGTKCAADAIKRDLAERPIEG